MLKKLLLFLLLCSPIYATPIDVSELATSGNGTQASCWRGWDTAITWVGEQEFYFPGGIYCYDISPNFLKPGIALRGEAGTILKHTGSGNAVVFDNPGHTWTQNVRMENFIIQGNSGTTNGLFLRGVRNGYFKHIGVRDVTGAGLWSEACVTNELHNFRVTYHEPLTGSGFLVRPAYGIVFATRVGFPIDGTTVWTVTNPVIEGTSKIGIWIKSGWGHVITGGTSEGNLGKGMVIEASYMNTIIGTDFEANGGTDIEIYANRNSLQNVASSGLLNILAGLENKIEGGMYANIAISGQAAFTFLEGMRYNGSLADSSPSTIKIGIEGTVDGWMRFDSRILNVIPYPRQAPLYGDIIKTDARTSSFWYFTAFSSVLLDNPTNPNNGQTITWRIQQGPQGNATVTFGSQFKPKAGQSLPTLTTVPRAMDYFKATYNSFSSTWDIQ